MTNVVLGTWPNVYIRKAAGGKGLSQAEERAQWRTLGDARSHPIHRHFATIERIQYCTTYANNLTSFLVFFTYLIYPYGSCTILTCIYHVKKYCSKYFFLVVVGFCEPGLSY